MLNIKEVRAMIHDITKYSESVWAFRFRLPDGESFPFTPGQFVMLSLPGHSDANGRKISKAYSIASAPDKSGIVELCIVKYPTGALSPFLFSKAIGEEVVLTGPYGVFAVKKPVLSGTIFIAGGTGLAPLMSILRSIYSEGYSEKLWLFYSIGSPQLFLFREELLGYSANSNLNVIASTSNPDASWAFENGRVTDCFPKFLPELQKDGIQNESRQFYICGPPLMVTDTVKMLEEFGFKRENIHMEKW